MLFLVSSVSVVLPVAVSLLLATLFLVALVLAVDSAAVECGDFGLSSALDFAGDVSAAANGIPTAAIAGVVAGVVVDLVVDFAVGVAV